MRKKIAKWLNAIARKLYKEGNYDLIENYEPAKLGVGYHITKSEVKKYRKANPDCPSHRQGVIDLVEETKKVILSQIAQALDQKGLVTFDIKRTLWTADVSGFTIVYKNKS